MGDEFFRYEDVDAVRMSWNIWPRNKVDAAKCVVPFAALYTPVKPKDELTARFNFPRASDLSLFFLCISCITLALLLVTH